MLVAFGISTPPQWRPRFVRKRTYFHAVWLWFEIVGVRGDFVTLQAESYVEQLSEELDANGGEITYRRSVYGGIF